MELSEIIKEWKETGITSAEFNFSAGGDSMGDTEINFYKDKTIVDFKYSQEIEDLIYKNVDFYEVTDGHYLGESGVVTVELGEEGDDFNYRKDSQSEYSNSYSENVKVQLNDTQYQYLKTYVKEVDDEYDSVQFRYKIDFYKDKDKQAIEIEIKEIIREACEEVVDNLGKDIEDYQTVSDLTFFENNTIGFNFNYSQLEYESNN